MHEHSPTRAPEPVATRSVTGLERLQRHLQAHVADEVSLDEMAAVAGLSKYHLLRTFRRAHGVSPHEYQMQLRVARARAMIAEGVSLSRVTYDAGFYDQSHMTRRFKQLIGMTPSRYAQELRVSRALESVDAATAGAQRRAS